MSNMEVKTLKAVGDFLVNWGLGCPSSCGVLVRDALVDYFMIPEATMPLQYSSLSDEQPSKD